MVRRNECYTLHLLSANGDGANNNEKTYSVEWSSFLPKEFKRYKVMMLFTSAITNQNIAPGFLVRAGIPCSTTLSNITGKRRSVLFGMADQETKSAGNYHYQITKDSSAEHCIEYPTENRFTIELVDSTSTSGALQANAPAYNVFLLFFPVV